jgi:hypothetical protein
MDAAGQRRMRAFYAAGKVSDTSTSSQQRAANAPALSNALLDRRCMKKNITSNACTVATSFAASTLVATATASMKA